MIQLVLGRGANGSGLVEESCRGYRDPHHYGVGGYIAIMAPTPEDEGFNSSDVEILETSPSKSRQIGEASLDIILAHAKEDRILSKRREKTLSYHAVAPTTQQMVDLGLSAYSLSWPTLCVSGMSNYAV